MVSSAGLLPFGRPLVLLVLAGFGIITTIGALIASQIVLVVALGAFALLALRRMDFTPWRKVILVAIGGIVVVVELLAHSL